MTNEEKAGFKWYWLLENEVVVCVGYAALFMCLLLLPADYRSGAFTAVVVVVAAVLSAYRKKLSERLGPGRVTPPRSFMAFLRFVAFIEVALSFILLEALRG
jgi:hypothetical protein